MTSPKRNLAIIGVMLLLLGLAGGIILSKSTVLGLDLRGGVELVYEASGTPKQPEVTPESIDDAIQTIRKRVDSIGVSESEIQRAGQNQISIGLPSVDNADRAAERVGTTAQLQFYDWEANVLGDRGPDSPYTGSTALFDAARVASKQKPKAERTDIAPTAPKGTMPEDADATNDSTKDKFYLFGPDQRLILGPDDSCEDLLSDFEAVEGDRRTAKQIPKGGTCEKRLLEVPLGDAESLKSTDQAQPRVTSGPPAGSRVLKVPRGIVVVENERPEDAPATAPAQYYVVEDDSELDGTQVENPEPSIDQASGQGPGVAFQFTDSGKAAFEKVTKRLAQRGSRELLPPGANEAQRDQALQRFAITLDDRIVSLATIDFREYPEGIPADNGAQISGVGTIQDANDLAEQLRIGALPIDLKQISQSKVSATLGAQALNQGLIAGGVGMLLTIIFLLLFYRVLGAVAATALVVYAVLLFAMAKLIPITLTLPGVAGLVLTLGVAADANIVIFERIKEEARSGRSVPAAISNGYAKALRTIIDANVVTIGVAFILFTLATAGVKGFAFTLGIGTIVSLFTAVLATSAILGAMARTRLIGSRFAIGAGEKPPRKFDFVGKSKWFFSGSGLILVAGALAIAGLGIKFGIDFESGTRIKTPVEQSATVDQVRDSLSSIGLGDAKIQKIDEPELGSSVFQIATETLKRQEITEVRETLDADFGVDQADFNNNLIGPTFGATIARSALIAILASLILISLYIALRFETKFAVPVLIALAHDILITSGVYALLGREVTTPTVAALLTILGYSLYDTIIVFDRIRENVPRMPRAAFSQIVNRSMSEVLTRSLATSFSTLMPVSALMLFGGETLRDFAFALLVGIASGAYSSIFIAAPVLTLWKERESIYVRRRRLIMDENGGRVPAFATGKFADSSGGENGARANKRRTRPGALAEGMPLALEPEVEPLPPERSRRAAGGPRGIRGGDSDGDDASRPGDAGEDPGRPSRSSSSSTGGPRGARSSRAPKKHGRR